MQAFDDIAFYEVPETECRNITKPTLVKAFVRLYDDEDPDISYLRQDYADCSPEEAEKYKAQDAERLQGLRDGQWGFYGIRIEATFLVPIGNGSSKWEGISSGGLWGIESDSDEAYFKEVGRDELYELRKEMEQLNISDPFGVLREIEKQLS